MKKVLVINGSIHGDKGNSQEIVKFLLAKNSSTLFISSIVLKDSKKEDVEAALNDSDGFVFISGTYWESWGTPIQDFFEHFTYLETTKTFMGKPCGAVVLSHSTGGRGVLSRLLVNLNLFGCLIPPMSGVELSFVGQEALKYSPEESLLGDVWSFNDVELVLENIESCLNQTYKFSPWPVDTEDFEKVWLKK